MAIRLILTCSLLASFAYTVQAALQGTAKWVPKDAYVVASLRLGNLLEKSAYVETREWQPLLRKAEELLPELAPILQDPNATGINLRVPIRFFLRGGHEKDDPVALGAILLAADKEKVAISLATIAKKANLRVRKDKGLSVYLATGKNIGIALKGRTVAFVGIAPSQDKSRDPSHQVEEAARDFLKAPLENLPKHLDEHFGQPADVALYVDGNGFAKLARNHWPADRWKTLLPTFNTLLEGKVSAHLTSQKGRLVLEVEDPGIKPAKSDKQASGLPNHLLDALPGDAPFVVGLSFGRETLRSILRESIRHFLDLLSKDKEKLNLDSQIPGFDASANDLLASPSGHIAFALGSFHKNFRPTAPNTPPAMPSPAILLGTGIESEFALGQLLAGANAANSLDTFLAFNGLHLTRQKGSLWLSTSEFRRETALGRPLRRLSKNRRELLAKHPVAADFDLRAFSRSLRNAGPLGFDILKSLDLLDEAERLVITGTFQKAKAIVRLRDKEANGWQVIGRHLAQEIIDRFNDELFRAIARNNPTEVIKAVNAGALVNAPDRFGHSPMHYAAYKGNAAIVEFLIDRGGNPNTRGRHDSTPLHSAAWGRNRRTLEVLLENGADVNARTDEGETPGMTASLRGEKETLEILLALSADPHAKDIHGTSLAELAAAGGHKPIVELLRQIGVKVDHPLHVAAGLGDIKTVKEFLDKGKDVNTRDGFGATPLLIATVAGREDMVEFLLEHKADPTLPAKDGYSLMHGAAFSGKKALIRKALSLGIEINSRYGPDGITPVDVANEDTDAAQYLRAHGGRTGWELGRP